MSIDITDIERIHANSGEPPTSLWGAMGADDVGIVFLVGIAQAVEEVDHALQKMHSTLDLPFYDGLATTMAGKSLELKLLIFGAWDSQDDAQAVVLEISEDVTRGPAEWAETMCEIAHRCQDQDIIATSDIVIPSELLENIFELYVNECRRAVSN